MVKIYLDTSLYPQIITNSEKINTCAHCKYLVGYTILMENQNIIFKKNYAKHSFGKSCHQVLQKKSLLKHKILYMKESDIFLGIANIKQPQREISPNIKGQYMKVSNALAGNATLKQLQREILLNTKGLSMKE